MTEFSNLGGRCSIVDCNVQDFLPYTCDQCGKVFCENHYQYANHNCEKYRKDRRVIICPICQASISYNYGEDENLIWLQHANSGVCKPAGPSVTSPKKQSQSDSRSSETAASGPSSFGSGGQGQGQGKKCPVKGCKTKLTTVNLFYCPKCRTEVCMKHRFPEDHDCTTRRSEWSHVGTYMRSSSGSNSALGSNPLPRGPGPPGPDNVPSSPDVLQVPDPCSPVGLVGSMQNTYSAPAEQKEKSYRSNGNPLGALIGRNGSLSKGIGSPDDNTTEDNYRSCPACSLHNSREAVHCVACGSKLKGGDCCIQ